MTAKGERRCAYIYRDTPKAREKNKVGKQCGMYSVNETPFCKFHGGNSRHVIERYQRERFQAEFEAQQPSFTDMWPEDHELLDPFSILLWEIRRCGARIEWFDAKISDLKEEREIWWGITKEESIGATEFTGINKTYEARENVLVRMQNEERKRLADLRKQWQDDRFEAARIAGMGAFATAARGMVKAIAEEFDLDLGDPEIQQRITVALQRLDDPLPALKAPSKTQERAGR